MNLLKKIASTSSSFALFPIRIALALVMMGHGAQKLFGWFGGGGLEKTAEFVKSLGFQPEMLFAILASGSEFVGGFLVLIGLMTRPAALALAFTMGVAVLKVHSSAFFLSSSGMEYALTLLLASLALLIGGAGRFSFDRQLAS